MKAVYIAEHGGVDKLLYGELPDPVHEGSEVLVRVRACGVNHVDLWVRQGLPFLRVRLPFILGVDVAGEVVAVGPGARSVEVGTRVMLFPGISCGRCEHCLAGEDNLCPHYELLGKSLPGGYAQLVKIPSQNLIPLPATITWEEAACIPVAFGTAWNMVFEKAGLHPGEWILIHAAGSTVGSAAIQLARLVGANIITTAGSDEKLEKARALGAQYLINYRRQDFLHEVRRITKKRGVDVVIEHIGEEVWERSLLCLATGGRLVTCGATSGYQAKTDLRHVFFRHLQIFGSNSATKAAWFKISRLLQEGKIRPVLDRVLPLTEAQQAHRLLEERTQFGKVVLVPE
ncbi:MAG: zinc-binding dehydrogenase [Candidatus Rokubacteria bacterium]|nr:zinc-binding dehydrogenase [Candidatus Rokubacteria bacterium]